jgi:hypothetical protein
MNVPNETLDRFARIAFETNRRLLHAGDALRQGRTLAGQEISPVPDKATGGCCGDWWWPAPLTPCRRPERRHSGASP